MDHTRVPFWRYYIPLTVCFYGLKREFIDPPPPPHPLPRPPPNWFNKTIPSPQVVVEESAALPSFGFLPYVAILFPFIISFTLFYAFVSTRSQKSFGTRATFPSKAWVLMTTLIHNIVGLVLNDPATLAIVVIVQSLLQPLVYQTPTVAGQKGSMNTAICSALLNVFSITIGSLYLVTAFDINIGHITGLPLPYVVGSGVITLADVVILQVYLAKEMDDRKDASEYGETSSNNSNYDTAMTHVDSSPTKEQEFLASKSKHSDYEGDAESQHSSGSSKKNTTKSFNESKGKSQLGSPSIKLPALFRRVGGSKVMKSPRTLKVSPSGDSLTSMDMTEVIGGILTSNPPPGDVTGCTEEFVELGGNKAREKVEFEPNQLSRPPTPPNAEAGPSTAPLRASTHEDRENQPPPPKRSTLSFTFRYSGPPLPSGQTMVPLLAKPPKARLSRSEHGRGYKPRSMWAPPGGLIGPSIATNTLTNSQGGFGLSHSTLPAPKPAVRNVRARYI